ncbi:hypothetical protein [Teredinibacter haidensis]|uniref:hypothetical protein n=1 Tax=Teredinibacter haidensis TaxID=2731755 RepID=UPI000AD6E058|nr:hypothetical protein [Teredinibacter haidensis]
MSIDEGKRSQSGVVSSLVELDDGKVRLIFDDVKNLSSADKGPWQYHTLFTFNDYDKSKVFGHDLSESELAEIGFNLLVRLGVLHEKPIK